MAKNITVTTNDGREVELTEAESAFLRAIRRLEKMPMERLQLFGSGRLDIRLNDDDEFDGFNSCSFESFNISCEGGDGGD